MTESGPNKWQTLATKTELRKFIEDPSGSVMFVVTGDSSELSVLTETGVKTTEIAPKDLVRFAFRVLRWWLLSTFFGLRYRLFLYASKRVNLG